MKFTRLDGTVHVLSAMEKVTYTAQRFQVCYWALHEAYEQGREFSYFSPRLS